jgi:predicted nucleotidyltransferase
MALPKPVEAYATELTRRLRETLGPSLTGVYIHGSAVLGDYSPVLSDVDILAISDRRLTGKEKRQLAKQLAERSLPTPGKGLEFHIVTEAALGDTGPIPAFELHLTTGEDAKIVDGERVSGDPDLLMHFAVLREHGYAIIGPEPHKLFPAVPRLTLLHAFAGELRWAEQHASPSYQTLNACRAWRFLEENVVCSKVDGGEWARSHTHEHTAVDTALRHRRGLTEDQPDAKDARALLRTVLRKLEGAS